MAPHKSSYYYYYYYYYYGSLRACLDPRDLNRAIKREHYVIPTFEDVSAKLCGKRVYSVIDMKDGFWQVKLDEESSRLCTFNSPFGRYSFCRLPFGISSAPEVFEKKVTETFGDIDGVELYLYPTVGTVLIHSVKPGI